MNNQASEEDSRGRIAIYIAGQRHMASLIELSEEHAKVRVLGAPTPEPGVLASLSIVDLPTFSGDILKVDADVITMEFRSRLHPSVVEYIDRHAENNSRQTPSTIQQKRATTRPPFPFDE